MASRADKMYANGPKIESDENGKKVVKKGPTAAEKKSSEVNSGTDGIAETDVPFKELVEKHAKERFDLYQKHEKDYNTAAAKLATGPDTGAGLIDKVEGDK